MTTSERDDAMSLVNQTIGKEGLERRVRDLMRVYPSISPEEAQRIATRAWEAQRLAPDPTADELARQAQLLANAPLNRAHQSMLAGQYRPARTSVPSCGTR